MNKVSLAEAGDGSPPFWRRYVVEDFLKFEQSNKIAERTYKITFTQLK